MHNQKERSPKELNQRTRKRLEEAESPNPTTPHLLAEWGYHNQDGNSTEKIESTNKENNTRSGLPKSYQDRTEKGTGQKQFARSHPLPWNRDQECRWCCGWKIWPPVSPRMWRCVLVSRAGSIAVPTKERHCCLGSYGREWKASFDVFIGPNGTCLNTRPDVMGSTCAWQSPLYLYLRIIILALDPIQETMRS